MRGVPVIAATAGPIEALPAPVLPADLPWVELITPSHLAVRGAPALVEVRGRAGRGPRAALELVVVIDLSASTLTASGMDVDADGVVGVASTRSPRNAFGDLRPYRTWTTDSGDTVMAAEILAAHRLLRRLDAATTRVGIVSFTGRPRIVASIGSIEDAAAALNGIRAALDTTGTNLGGAVRVAASMLQRSERRGGGAARKAVLVLSDGSPTVPHPELFARSFSVTAARWAASRNIAVHGFAIGDPRDDHVLADMAAVSGGEFLQVRDVSDVVEYMPYTDLAGIELVSIHNRTAGVAGRAVRLFSDGSFDGLVPLVSGENLVEVRVRSRQGTEVFRLCTITYDDAAAADAERGAALYRELKLRTHETELAARAKASRPAPRDVRRVEIRAED